MTGPSFSVFVRNLGERVLHRPLVVRDHILRARSDDGLEWEKEDRFRLVHPSLTNEHMNYFCTMDERGLLWWRASLFDRKLRLWHTELGYGRSWLDVRAIGLQHLYSPSWCATRLFAVGEFADARRDIVCFERDGFGWPKTRELQSWDRLHDLGTPEDVFVIQDPEGGFRGWCSIAESPTLTSIHAWRSRNGNDWNHIGRALGSPHQDHWYQLANNPSLVQSAQGRWRLYFRTGTQPVLGNEIRSASSTDLINWQHDTGTRAKSGGQWDTHGVGFPFVVRERPAGPWRMYYTGYWGDSRSGSRAAASWRENGEELHRLAHDAHRS